MFLRKVFTVLAAVATTSFAPVASAASMPKIDQERLVRVEGEVRGNALEAGNQIAALSETKGDIWLIINSPGGSVTTGLFTVSAMDLARARGRKINCVVPGLAASMAFHMLTHCNERYVLPKTLLLWHPVRAGVGGALTPAQARLLAEDLERVEKSLIDDIFTQLGISKEVFMYHYNAETLFLATELDRVAPGFLTIVDDIPGVIELFHFERGLFGMRGNSTGTCNIHDPVSAPFDIRFEMNVPLSK